MWGKKLDHSSRSCMERLVKKFIYCVLFGSTNAFFKRTHRMHCTLHAYLTLVALITSTLSSVLLTGNHIFIPSLYCLHPALVPFRMQMIDYAQETSMHPHETRIVKQNKIEKRCNPFLLAFYEIQHCIREERTEEQFRKTNRKRANEAESQQKIGCLPSE